MTSDEIERLLSTNVADDQDDYQQAPDRKKLMITESAMRQASTPLKPNTMAKVPKKHAQQIKDNLMNK